jgi:hypothetical protein
MLSMTRDGIPKDRREFIGGAVELLEPDIVQVFECQEFQWGEHSATKINNARSERTRHYWLQ